jgi:hypothetical protein
MKTTLVQSNHLQVIVEAQLDFEELVTLWVSSDHSQVTLPESQQQQQQQAVQVRRGISLPDLEVWADLSQVLTHCP